MLESSVNKPKQGGYDPLDIHIGQRIRDTRLARNMKLETLSERLGIISQQQLQKYESGANRVSGSMMFRIASILEVHPGHFFSGLVDPRTKQKLPEVGLQGHKILRQLDGLDPDLAEILEKLVSKVKRIGNNP
ncbi:helix-turn-helix domain-containing protein [Aureimonas ureilytica]|uniref:helix-turn-helix domain-containing protein n=1 Tax=Aureimonas ureilytica TaxID=401562 RepID=UPI0012DF195B|nr:helix-turn-helix transcriptional regulator [Aureimonas ureilytica]